MTAGDRERAAVFTWGEAASGAMFFAATYPERVTSMVLVNAYARNTRSTDCPSGMPEHLVKTTALPFARLGARAWRPSSATRALCRAKRIDVDGANGTTFGRP